MRSLEADERMREELSCRGVCHHATGARHNEEWRRRRWTHWASAKRRSRSCARLSTITISGSLIICRPLRTIICEPIRGFALYSLESRRDELRPEFENGRRLGLYHCT